MGLRKKRAPQTNSVEALVDQSSPKNCSARTVDLASMFGNGTIVLSMEPWAGSLRIVELWSVYE